jgi:hypothetical protein
MKVVVQSIATGAVKETGQIVLEDDSFLASGSGKRLLDKKARVAGGRVFTKEDGSDFLSALCVMYSGVYFRVVPDDFDLEPFLDALE